MMSANAAEGHELRVLWLVAADAAAESERSSPLAEQSRTTVAALKPAGDRYKHQVPSSLSKGSSTHLGAIVDSLKHHVSRELERFSHASHCGIPNRLECLLLALRVYQSGSLAVQWLLRGLSEGLHVCQGTWVE